MNRRLWLRHSAAAASLTSLPLLASRAVAGRTDPAAPRQRLAAAWRVAAAPAGQPADRVGILELDWPAGQVRVRADHPAPERAHGLLALADGGFIAVANRPGRWLLHCDAQGRERRRVQLDAERPQRTLNGHVEPSLDGRRLFSTETDPRDGSSWLSVREADTLRRVADWRLPGVDAHQMLLDEDGQLLIALGGIPRNAAGRKIQIERMSSALIRFDPVRGAVTGEWRLPDSRLSLRHLAWSEGQEGPALLGIGLQAEHDDPAQRERAPALAIWDGQRLFTPSHDAQAGGYAGDVVAAPGGGFMITSDKTDRGLWWHPAQPRRLTTVAQLQGIYALAPFGTSGSPPAAAPGEAPDDEPAPAGGTLFASHAGVARWQPQGSPQWIAWPMPMSLDNHWVTLADA